MKIPKDPCFHLSSTGTSCVTSIVIFCFNDIYPYMLLKKKKVSDTCESTVQRTFFKGLSSWVQGASTVGDRRGSTPSAARARGVPCQRVGLGSVDGKFLIRNIRGKVDSS